LTSLTLTVAVRPLWERTVTVAVLGLMPVASPDANTFTLPFNAE